jgi:hypothetical protein
MEEGMEELYVEGLATHGEPESCVDDPRGRGAGNSRDVSAQMSAYARTGNTPIR